MTPTEAAGRLGYYLDQIETCAGDAEEVRRYVAEAQAVLLLLRSPSHELFAVADMLRKAGDRALVRELAGSLEEAG